MKCYNKPGCEPGVRVGVTTHLNITVMVCLECAAALQTEGRLEHTQVRDTRTLTSSGRFSY